MKGTFFLKPIEFVLNIEGETWLQGEELKGELIARNHQGQAAKLDDYLLSLSIGDKKKIKAKDQSAFVEVESVKLTGEIAAGAELNIAWNFSLKNDAWITEKNTSLYLICANKTDVLAGGQLELQVNPGKAMNQFIEILSTFFRFKLKTLKNKKGQVEAVFSAPNQKDLSMVEQLNLGMHLNEQALELKYEFKVKKLSFDQHDTKTKSVKVLKEDSLALKQHGLATDYPRQELIIKAIEKVIDPIKRKSVF